MDPIFVKRLETLVSRHDARVGHLTASVTQAKNFISYASSTLAKLEETIAMTTEQNKTERELLLAMKDDPVVIVKTGYRPYTYHSSRSTCGVAPAYRERILLGEARSRGLTPCTFCGYSL